MNDSSMSVAGRKKSLMKIVLLGDQAVGKTSLINQYIGNRFSHQYRSTIGTDFHVKEIIIPEYPTTVITLQIWDTAGLERFHSLNASYYRGADCCMLVYDVTMMTSFKTLASWRDNFFTQSNVRCPEKFPFIVVGNKVDLENRAVSARRAEQWCTDNKMPYFECSALTAANVDTAFRHVVTMAMKSTEMSSMGDYSFQETIQPNRTHEVATENRCYKC